MLFPPYWTRQVTPTTTMCAIGQLDLKLGQGPPPPQTASSCTTSHAKSPSNGRCRLCVALATRVNACTTPTDINVADITPASAVVSWQGTSDAYNLKYRRLPASTDATVVLTVGDVWGDGTGYQMLLDGDATAYGSFIEIDMSDEDYSQFEYKIPENADGSLTTQNIVFNSSVSITIPAGTYDWYITNPSPEQNRIFIASSNGNVSGRQDNYQFEVGKRYEFTVSLDGEHDRVDVDITTIASPSGSATEDEPWTLVENVTSPYTINGLVDGTMYEVSALDGLAIIIAYE